MLKKLSGLSVYRPTSVESAKIHWTYRDMCSQRERTKYNTRQVKNRHFLLLLMKTCARERLVSLFNDVRAELNFSYWVSFNGDKQNDSFTSLK